MFLDQGEVVAYVVDDHVLCSECRDEWIDDDGEYVSLTRESAFDVMFDESLFCSGCGEIIVDSETVNYF